MKALAYNIERYKSYLACIKLEAIIWIAGLVVLMMIDPYSSEHLSVCPLHNIGLDFCPGCGLGRSISLIFHGDIAASFNAHPLGIPALVILIHRIAILFYRSINMKKNALINTTGGYHG